MCLFFPFRLELLVSMFTGELLAQYRYYCDNYRRADQALNRFDQKKKSE
jgi:hypothetical protein